MEIKKKLTKVQQWVMSRFDRGERLVFMPTNRMSGDAMFWVRVDEEEGIARVIEKALYPQLRRLFWDKVVTEENGLILDRATLKFDESDYSILHREGCIGF